jgi:hypothetical protein
MAVALFAVVSMGCATTMTVGSHIAPGLDVAPYRTFDWGPADRLPAGDPRLAKDPFFLDHVEGAIERGLAALGYQRATTSWPDLLVHYHASITRRMDVATIENRNEYCAVEPCGGRVEHYEAGTIVIDILDARTNRVLWRGWAQDSVEGPLKDQNEMAKKIDEAVNRMLQQFPRGVEQVIAMPADDEY